MSFDDLPKDVQHDLQVNAFRMEIEADEDDRRMFTTFGYNWGKMSAMLWCVYAPFMLSVFTIIGLMMFDVSHHTSIATSPFAWWVMISPFAVLLVTPFLFLKPRYAVRAVGPTIAFAVVLALLLALFNTIRGGGAVVAVANVASGYGFKP